MMPVRITPTRKQIRASTILALLTSLAATVGVQAQLYEFDYTSRTELLADGWGFNARGPEGQLRTTEQTVGAVPSYNQSMHPGVLRIPADVGRLWDNANDSRNNLFRDLPPDWNQVTLSVSVATPVAGLSVGLALYADDDNYVEFSWDGSQGNRLLMSREVGGAPYVYARATGPAPGAMLLRLYRDRLNEVLTSSYSVDGVNWTVVGHLLNVGVPVRLGIDIGQSQSGFPPVDLAWVRLENDAAAPPAAAPMALGPRAIVFNVTQGTAAPGRQVVNVFHRGSNPVTIQLDPDVTWLHVDPATAATPVQIHATVSPEGLAPGVYDGHIIVTASDPVFSDMVLVKLVVNGAGPVQVATWRHGHQGAVSFSTDDSFQSCNVELRNHGLRGSFFLQDNVPYPFAPEFQAAGMEIGTHSVTHPCVEIDELHQRYDQLEPNINHVAYSLGLPESGILAHAWPCGVAPIDSQAVASEYFLAARGYGVNRLEDATPPNFYNLRSYNDPADPAGHGPPTNDLKLFVDLAEAVGKWAIFVFHSTCADDGAIAYSASRDVWVAPVGTVVKYIRERQRFVLGPVTESDSSLSFQFSRAEVPDPPGRSLDSILTADDLLTLLVDVDDGKDVQSVLLDGAPVSYQLVMECGNKKVMADVPVATAWHGLSVIYGGASAPVLSVCPEMFDIELSQGNSPVTLSLSVLDAGSGQLDWTAAVGAASPWLQVAPGAGATPAVAVLTLDTTALAPGSYTGLVTVIAESALGSPVSVPVHLTLRPDQVVRYALDFPSRESLLAAGWDFIARTAAGSGRNTEQTSEAVVSYDQSIHPGVLRIPADVGDLWQDLNNTRNSLFRDLPASWTSVRLKLSFDPLEPFQQAGLVVYGNDDTYAQVLRTFESIGPSIAVIRENQGSAVLVRQQAEPTSDEIVLRLDRDQNNGVIVASYSTDEMLWQMPTSVAVDPANPRLGIIVGGSQFGFPNADLAWAEIVSSAPSEPFLAASPTSLAFTSEEGAEPGDLTLYVRNAGGGLLTWTLTPGGSTPWLHVSTLSGSGDADVQVSIDATGLTAGTYSSSVTVQAPGAAGSPQTIPVQLTITAPTPPPPDSIRYNFTYADRASLLSAGWSYLARTASGSNRNTEQTSGAVVSYDQALHPGTLRIPADTGDLWASLNNTRNSLFRDLPTSWTSVRVKLSFAPSQPTQQAGLVVYSHDDDYVQVTKVQTYSGPTVAMVRETPSSADLINQHAEPVSTGLILRLDRNPATSLITGSYSLDGNTWITLTSVNATLANPRLGILVCASPSGLPVADIEWAEVVGAPATPSLAVSPTSLTFTAQEGSNPAARALAVRNVGGGILTWTLTPGGSAPWLHVSTLSGSGDADVQVSIDATGLTAGTYSSSVTVQAPGAAGSPQTIPVQLTITAPTPPPPDSIRYNFTYADRASLLSAGWSYLARTASGSNRNTEQTSGAVVSYDQALHPGTLRIPADTGDLWASLNNTRNSLFRDLPTSWTSVRVKLSFAPSQPTQQAGLVVYSHDDDYVQVTKVQTYSGPTVAMVRETPSTADLINQHAEPVSTGLILRLDRNPATSLITGSYSLDGNTWITLTSVNATLANPRLGILVCASPSGLPVADIEWAEVVGAPATPSLAVSPTSLTFTAQEGSNPAARALAVRNVGGGILTWTLTPGGSAPWLHVSTLSGSGDADVQVSIDATGLTAGTYSSSVTVQAPGAAGSPQTIPVQLTITAPTPPPPDSIRYNFTYADRASLLSAGWSYLARTASGSNRNTEQTSGAVVSYDQALHPGTLRIPADTGDLWASLNNTRNSLFRDLPTSWTSVRVKLSFAPSQPTQQAGLVVYSHDDDYVQVTKVQTYSGPTVAMVRETPSTADLINQHAEPVSTGLILRLDRNPATSLITGSYSLDGNTWITLTSVNATLANPRLGILVCASPSGLPVADIEWAEVVGAPATPSLAVSPTSLTFTAQEGSNPAARALAVRNVGGGTLTWTLTPGGSAPWLHVSTLSGSGDADVQVSIDATGLTAGTYSSSVTVQAPGAAGSPQTIPVQLTVTQPTPGATRYNFTYTDRSSTLAAGWNYLARTASGSNRNTEQTSGAVVSYDQALHPGTLRIPADTGDLWASLNNTRNSLFRDLPTSWTSVRVKLSFAPSQPTQQAGLVVYSHDNDYVQVTKVQTYSGPMVAMVRETPSSASLINQHAEPVSTGLILRLDRNPATSLITGSYSLDGNTWITLTSVNATLANPRLGIIVCASPSGLPVADIEWAEVFE